MTLRCLGGGAAPEGVADDLARLAALPDGALAELWSVLAPSLADKLDARVEQALTDFSERHRLVDADVAHGLKAARFLVREASREGAGSEAMRADLEALLGAGPGARLWSALEPRYVEVVRSLRFEIVREALLGHGAVFLGASWRSDVVSATEKGRALGTPVALLTLRYRRQGKEKALTLQALPEDLLQLRDLVEQALQAVRPT